MHWGHQLVEVSRGLHHIHDLNIVHGSIRGVWTSYSQWPFCTHYNARQTSVSMTKGLPGLQDLLLLQFSCSPILRWKTLMSLLNPTCRGGAAPKSYILEALG